MKLLQSELNLSLRPAKDYLDRIVARERVEIETHSTEVAERLACEAEKLGAVVRVHYAAPQREAN